MIDDKRLTIIQINDIHGYLEPHPELIWDADGPAFPTLGGFARIAAVINKVKAEVADDILVLDNGDTLHGTYPAVVNRGVDIVPVANALGIDAMTALWEFA